jgi:tetratricopeptide (TPR) repeat protein
VLERPTQRSKVIRTDLDLLIPYQRKTAFVGRQAELAALQVWVRSDAPESVRVMTGGGGSPEQTLALRERAAEVDALLVAALRLSESSDEEARAELARVLNNLGIRLGDLGRWEEALQATGEAVGIRRQLAAQRPDAFLPT